MTAINKTSETLDNLYAAIERGDLKATMACFTDDARVWHSFDGIAQDRDAFRVGFRHLIDNMGERRVYDIRRQKLPDGLLQQHVMVVTLPSGERKAWPVCIIVRVVGDKIARIDEYIDRAGSFDPGSQGDVPMPGM
jgi:ketosteroid isomerase-like protein